MFSEKCIVFFKSCLLFGLKDDSWIFTSVTVFNHQQYVVWSKYMKKILLYKTI